MTLLLTPEAERGLSTMPKADRARIVAALKQVAAEPSQRWPFVTQLVGQGGVWRLRKGDWRAVYRIVSGDVVVDRVGHRKEIYR